MIPPELAQAAADWFVLAGGPDPAAWPGRVTLGLQGLAIAAAVLALLFAALALASRTRA